jgi:hypothetical protein
MIIRAVGELALAQAALLPGGVDPYAAAVGVGFALGVIGHLARSRVLIVVGVILVLLGAALFPLAPAPAPEHASPSLESSP